MELKFSVMSLSEPRKDEPNTSYHEVKIPMTAAVDCLSPSAVASDSAIIVSYNYNDACELPLQIKCASSFLVIDHSVT